MKKTFALLLIAMLLMSVCACSAPGDDASGTVKDPSGAATDDAKQTGEPYEIGFKEPVFDQVWPESDLLAGFPNLGNITCFEKKNDQQMVVCWNIAAQDGVNAIIDLLNEYCDTDIVLKDGTYTEGVKYQDGDEHKDALVRVKPIYEPKASGSYEGKGVWDVQFKLEITWES